MTYNNNEQAEIARACRELGITRIPLGSPLYPRLLTPVSPPKVLYAKGNLDLLREPAIAVVGARKASVYGLAAARAVASRLSENGYCVVSGMALGVDSAAHEAVLRRGGHTIAVMGCGLDICYPASHKALFDALCDKGLVVSQFAPGEQPLQCHFPMRNRVISGLSLAVVVVEAGLKSGSLLTAEAALDLGREVYCVPGSIFLPYHQGSNLLLADGATLVGSLEDLPSLYIRPQSDDPPAPALGLSAAESSVLPFISDFGSAVDEISRASGQSPAAVGAALAKLQLAGLIERDLGGNYYVLHR